MSNSAQRSSSIGPIVDDSTLFSAVGEAEPPYQHRLLAGYDIFIKQKPSALTEHTYWQLVAGSFVSITRKSLTLWHFIYYLATVNY